MNCRLLMFVILYLVAFKSVAEGPCCQNERFLRSLVPYSVGMTEMGVILSSPKDLAAKIKDSSASV